MASLAQLTSDVRAWLNRRDIDGLIAGWVSMTETDIAEVLRARSMIARASQAIDANFITLPSGFVSFEEVRDYNTGALLRLEDNYSGPNPYQGGPATAYRLVGDCIEFLPHPTIGTTTDWQPQRVHVAYYRRPTALVAGADTNPVLENHYAIYLFGVCRYGALFELDDARAEQAQRMFAEQVTAANSWKQAADYSGAPLRAVMSGGF